MNINALVNEPKNILTHINLQSIFTIILAVLAVLFLPQKILAAEDIEPPNISAISINPTAIDVTSGSASVSVGVTITDDLSGFYSGAIYFYSPTTNVYRAAGFNGNHRTSGDALKGDYKFIISFPQFSEAGDWVLKQVYLTDVTTNRHNYNIDELTSLGFNRIITVTSTPDTKAPALTAISLNEVSVDASDGQVPVTMTVTIIDELDDSDPRGSGFNYGFLYLYSPTNKQYRSFYFRSYQLISGNHTNGTYKTTTSIPQYAEPGDWSFRYGYLYDKAGNRKYVTASDLSPFQVALAVSSDPHDVLGADLDYLSIEPLTVNTILGPDEATFTLGISDNLSGFISGSARVISPSGRQSHYFSWNSNHRTAGDALLGEYDTSKVFPQYSEYGDWKISYINLRDKTTNSKYYAASDLESLGLPSTLLIAGVISDGSGNYIVGSAGGTISTGDDILTLDFPEGALEGDTNISITRIGGRPIADTDIRIGTDIGQGSVIAEYNFEPDGQTFDEPLTVTMTIDVTKLNRPSRSNLDIYLYTDTDGDGIEDLFEPLPDEQIISVETIINDNGSEDMVFVFQLSHFSTYAVIEEIVNDADTTPPNVEITVPAEDSTLQGTVTLLATATDDSSIKSVNFTIREANEDDGVMIGYEDISAIQNTGTDTWKFADFDSSQLLDGHYVIFATAKDEFNNEATSEVVSFTIRNWSLMELLPATEVHRAGRTVPMKFSLRMDYETDPSMPFVHNEDLEIRIYDANTDTLMQTSGFGEQSTDYRIDDDIETYITNFKTSKIPGPYTAEIWRISNDADDYLIDTFTFETIIK